MKITKREIMFFIAGIITMLIIESVYDWGATKKAFQDGYKSFATVEKE